MQERVSALTFEQLLRILDYDNEFLLDDCNYRDGKFCPLAVAFNLHETVSNPSDDIIRDEIVRIGNAQIPDFAINPTKGIQGTFYTTNRRDDLMELVTTEIARRANLL